MSKHITIWRGYWQSPEYIPEHGIGNRTQWYFWTTRPRAPAAT